MAQTHPMPGRGSRTSMRHPKQNQQRGHSERQTPHTEEAGCRDTALHSLLLPEAGQTPKITPSLTHPPPKMVTQPSSGIFTLLSHHHQQPLLTSRETRLQWDVGIKAVRRKPPRCYHLGDAALAGRSLAWTRCCRGVAQPKPFCTVRKRHPTEDAFALVLKKRNQAERQGK